MIDNNSKNGFTVKFLSLQIQNFGCIKKGSFSMEKDNYTPQNLMGIYGQNGSGKSTLIRCFAFLRLLFCGTGIDDAGSYVRVGEDFASLKADFSITNKQIKKIFSYYVRIRLFRKQNRWIIEEENAYLSDSNNQKNKLSFCYDSTNSTNPITPINLKNNLISFIEKNLDFTEEVPSQLFFIMQKEWSRFYKTSYIFGEHLLSLYDSYTEQSKESILDYLKIFNDYAKNYFFVITDNFINGGLVNAKTIPVILPNQKVFSNGAINYFSLNIDGPTKALEPKEGSFDEFINKFNDIIISLCPETKLSFKKILGIKDSINSDPNMLENYYEVFTIKDNLEVPIKYESLGIKKIISLVNILIFAYGNPSVLLVIDELDSSINELVLDVFLKVFSENGSGQIIFTANNLHPLEILDKAECCFSTTNSSNRFVHLKYVKPNNNLRTLYISLAKQGGNNKNENLFIPLSEENMKSIFEKTLNK